MNNSVKLINQPYAMTIASYKSNIHVERVIDTLVKSLQTEMRYIKSEINGIFCNKIVTVRTRDFLPKGSKNYGLVKEALILLKKQVIAIRGVDEDGHYELFTGLILNFKYYNNNEIIKINFSSEILEFMLNNINGYTRFDPKMSFLLSSSYTSRIYKFISHWRDKSNGFKINLYSNQLRRMLAVGNKYNRGNALYQHILAPASEDLKKKSDMWFIVSSSIKEGRKIVGWEIKIYKKQKIVNLPLKENGEEDKKERAFKILLGYGIPEKKARQLVYKNDLNTIFKLNYSIKTQAGTNNQIKNPAGYIINSLELLQKEKFK